MATEAPPTRARTVYALEQQGRSVYCASASCVRALMDRGWKLSDSRQLMILVQDLASGHVPATHDPSDHFR